MIKGPELGILPQSVIRTDLDSMFWIFFKINPQSKKSKGMPGKAGAQEIVIDWLI